MTTQSDFVSDKEVTLGIDSVLSTARAYVSL